jgi:branched-chain amino acid transport system substrate-binding protein
VQSKLKPLFTVRAISWLLIAVGPTVAVLPLKTQAQSSTFGDKIIIGSAMALSAGSEFDGVSRKNAMEALVKKVNNEGGINGRLIQLKVYDDEHDPKKDLEITRKLIESENTFVLLNYLGTATASAVIPYVIKTNTLFFGAITGADVVRIPLHPTIFNVRASFNEEVEKLANHAVEKLGIKSIGMFFRDDAFGRAGRSSLFAALSKRSMKPGALGKHDSKSKDVSAGLAAILATKPEALMMWTSGPMAAKFMKEAALKGYKPTYFAPSPVAADTLARESGLEGIQAFLASGYPRVNGSNLPIAKEFSRVMTSAGFKEDQINDKSFEAYVNSAILFEGLKRAGKDLTRASFIGALDKMENVDFGGLKTSFGPKDHQAIHRVYLMQVKDGKVTPLE